LNFIAACEAKKLISMKALGEQEKHF